MKAGCVGVLLVVCAHSAVAHDQDEKKAATSPPAPPKAAAPAPIDPKALPPYFTGTSPDPDKLLWPDPTGANSATWAARSPGPVGDGGPKSKTTAELYDRIAHNLFSVHFLWTMVTGFLVMFMQAAFALLLRLRRLGGQGEEGFQ
jgi:Amt family ammonium transporter